MNWFAVISIAIIWFLCGFIFAYAALSRIAPSGTMYVDPEKRKLSIEFYNKEEIEKAFTKKYVLFSIRRINMPSNEDY